MRTTLEQFKAVAFAPPEVKADYGEVADCDSTSERGLPRQRSRNVLSGACGADMKILQPSGVFFRGWVTPTRSNSAPSIRGGDRCGMCATCAASEREAPPAQETGATNRLRGSACESCCSSARRPPRSVLSQVRLTPRVAVRPEASRWVKNDASSQADDFALYRLLREHPCVCSD